MNQDELFIMTMKELRERMNSNYKYDLVKACGLLRLLLMDDGAPLYVIVNRSRNVKILFTIAETPFHFGVGADLQWTHLRPIGEMKAVKIDAFLSTIMLVYKGHKYTVADIIRFGANVRGGVHAGVPVNPFEENYKSLDELREKVFDMDSASIHSICEVVIDGLKPLEDAVNNGHTPTGGY